MEAPLHPDIDSLACLLGTWRGEGHGVYPTIEPFRYSEEVAFTHTGKPFLAYRQTTVNLDTGTPAHAEVGYWRPGGLRRVELVLAHPTGVVEIDEGPVELFAGGVALHLRSTTVGLTATAKSVVSLERSIRVEGDELRYDLAMGAVDQPHQHHLSATLRRA
jgi:hypothetical protein